MATLGTGIAAAKLATDSVIRVEPGLSALPPRPPLNVDKLSWAGHKIAAAVFGTPIAIAVAQQLAVDPLPFVLAVLFGANMSFAAPFGYQTNF